jgi:hypothetical protein
MLALIDRVIDALQQVGWCKEQLAWGYSVKDKTPKDKEVMPWAQDVKLTKLSVLGAICFVADNKPSEPVVQEIVAACNAALRSMGVEWSLEVFNDAPDTTLDDIIHVLRTSQQFLDPRV